MYLQFNWHATICETRAKLHVTVAVNVFSIVSWLVITLVSAGDESQSGLTCYAELSLGRSTGRVSG